MVAGSEAESVTDDGPAHGDVGLRTAGFYLDVEVAVTKCPGAVAGTELCHRARIPGAIGIAERAVSTQSQDPTLGQVPGIARADHEIVVGAAAIDADVVEDRIVRLQLHSQ